MTIRPAYNIKTIYWGRYVDMYGDDWVDLESIHYAESLSEAITYANEQMTLPKTITSSVYSNFNNELMYKALPTMPTKASDATNSTIGMTNTVDYTNDQPNPPAHITRISPLTNSKKTLQIPQYTPEEFERRLYAYEKGNIDIDDALPLLSDAAKLFVTRGFTLEEWEEYESKL